jgi:predicted N-acetyltransferase YhbS
MTIEILTRTAQLADMPAIEQLHDRVFGPGALVRTAYRIREGMPSVSPFCRVALDGSLIISTLRFTPIRIGTKGKALMLGPLAVDPAYANQGHGRRLVREGLEAARSGGIALVVLVGDEAYYGRLGFAPIRPLGRITMPGPVDLQRVLAAELVPDALADYSGTIAPA